MQCKDTLLLFEATEGSLTVRWCLAYRSTDDTIQVTYHPYPCMNTCLKQRIHSCAQWIRIVNGLLLYNLFFLHETIAKADLLKPIVVARARLEASIGGSLKKDSSILALDSCTKENKMNDDFPSFIGSIQAAIRQENGPGLSSLLSLSSPQARAVARIPGGAQQRQYETQRLLSAAMGRGAGMGGGMNGDQGDWSEYVAHHVECLALILGVGSAGTTSNTRHVDAYDRFVLALTVFLKIFREDMGSWLVVPMHSVVHNLYSLADMADIELQQNNKKQCKLVDCGDQLRKCFSVSLQAPNNKEKKLAALDIVNVSIKIYFKLNTLRLCKNLIRTVESKQFPPFDIFPVSQKVTYKFYLGRLAVFDEKYEDAQDALTYALKYCHANHEKNKALILKYLIPVGLLLGRLPSAKLAQQYEGILRPYLPLAESLRSGNIGMFYDAMKRQRDILVKDGTYLLLEKLQAAVYRRLLRKVWIIHAQQEPAKAAQIPLSMFATALKVSGVDIDMDEIECIAANLISRKYVKGYISHKLKVMVVHKTHPFPDLSGVVLVDD